MLPWESGHPHLPLSKVWPRFRQQGEQLIAVLDSEYRYRGNVGWSAKWRRHGWHTFTGEVGHKELWEQILWLQEQAGALVQLRWVHEQHMN